MKKSLLATTALAALGAVAVSAPAVAQEKISISVGGYMEQWFGYADSDADNLDNGVNGVNEADGFTQISDGEIHFKGETTLDNGLTFGVNVQLEAETTGDTIDEQFAYVEGSFGRILIGDENSAPYLMVPGIMSNGLGIDSGDGDNYITGYDFAQSTTNGNFARDDNDSNKLTYFTPRFSGFQVGVSYIPDHAQDSDNPPNGADGTRDDGFAIAANYKQSFGDVSVNIGGGYQYYGDDDNVAEEPEAYGVGLRVGFAGFTVSGAYHQIEDRGGVNDADLETFGVGLAYNAGPFGVSLAYIRGEEDNVSDGGGVAVLADEEQDAFELGAQYKLGPGVTAKGSVFYGQQDRDGVAGDNYEGFAVSGGIALSF